MENPVPANPLCFVLMPFGRKTDARGRTTDFDAIYQQIIAPAVVASGLDPIRADEEKIGGTIHKPMFERLMLCQYAVADVTGANPNVYYELGIRHALRPRSTVILFAEGTTLPFDIALLRGIPYKTNDDGQPLQAEACSANVAEKLRTARQTTRDDSPLFELIRDMPRFEVDHSKTDTFRKQFDYSRKYKDQLTEARSKGADAVNAVMADPALSNLLEVETGVVIDLYLALRDVKNYGGMIELYKRMPEPLQRARVAREQLALAYNREGRWQEAVQILEDVLKEFGPSSETYGLLGRIHKDRWEAAKKAGSIEATALLKTAIGTYVKGFESDWRDAYPGVNAMTLMEMLDKPDRRQAQMLPVVRYAASQKAHRTADDAAMEDGSRKARPTADYWDHATLLELAVLARDQDDAIEKLGDTLAYAPPPAAWQLETTERNLRLIRELRTARGEDAAWIQGIEKEFAKQQASLKAAQKAS